MLSTYGTLEVAELRAGFEDFLSLQKEINRVSHADFVLHLSNCQGDRSVLTFQVMVQESA